MLELYNKRDIRYRDDVPVDSNYLAGVNENMYVQKKGIILSLRYIGIIIRHFCPDMNS